MPLMEVENLDRTMNAKTNLYKMFDDAKDDKEREMMRKTINYMKDQGNLSKSAKHKIEMDEQRLMQFQDLMDEMKEKRKELLKMRN